MDTQNAYNKWAGTYDAVINKTRDLEAIAIKQIIGNKTFDSILEIGCGTGKNTSWLAAKAGKLTAADFSTEMINKAVAKVALNNVTFVQADITKTWSFDKAGLITCSLVLEHIESIDFIFQQAAGILDKGGLFYICELHPYRQLQGSRARFEKEGSVHELEYFIHHTSQYFGAAKQNGFICDELKEWFDEDENKLPRLVSFLFKKK